MKSNEIIKKMKDFVEELENEELKESISIPSFADISKDELKEVLGLYRAGKIDLRDYWKPGDKKVTEDGYKYIILDIGYDCVNLIGNIKGYKGYCANTTRTVTIMRTDLVNFEVSLKSNQGDYEITEFRWTVLYRQFVKNPGFFIGDFFSGIARNVAEFSKFKVFLPSKEEIFDEEKAYEYFKNPENRKLGNSWWSRSGFLDPGGYARFVYCNSDGSQRDNFPNHSYGLAPCFAL